MLFEAQKEQATASAPRAECLKLAIFVLVRRHSTELEDAGTHFGYMTLP